jgi:hypothetical protein
MLGKVFVTPGDAANGCVDFVVTDAYGAGKRSNEAWRFAVMAKEVMVG